MAAKPRTSKTQRPAVAPNECDLVMAGGITSGVVFPPAIAGLAEDYRFKSVGGASAGAIAAAGAAAAEYGRRSGHAESFGILRKAQGELSENLATLFQPAPDVAPMMEFTRGLIIAAAGIAEGTSTGPRAWLAVIFRTIVLGCKHFPAAAGIGAIAFLVLSLPFFVASIGSYVFSAIGVIGTLLIAVAAVLTLALFLLAAIVYSAFRYLQKLKQHDFGFCPGPRQPGQGEGLMDWVAALIERAAGRVAPNAAPPEGHKPLTFGDLAARDADVTLRMTTTNLSLGVGYALPSLGKSEYFFKASELSKVLPQWVAKSMTDAARAEQAKKNAAPLQHDGEELLVFPTADQMPVVAAVRMSLCFPVLFTAFPLYRQEFAKRGKDEQRPAENPVRRVLFSDGGITSNFPSRFFDRLVPSRPTFGISLDEVPAGVDASKAPAPGDGRVYLPFDARQGGQFAISEIEGLFKFLSAIINTAREWQDRKQARLPGWRDRIARIYIAKGEGGLNLDMPKDLIDKLGTYGARAAVLMRGQAPKDAPHDDTNFDFADHQWRRFLIAYDQMSGMLGDFSEAWKRGVRKEVLDSAGAPPSYTRVSKAERSEMIARMDALATLGQGWANQPIKKNLPKISARLQIIPHDD